MAPSQVMVVAPRSPALEPLPSPPALSGLIETLAFFWDPDFARSGFERHAMGSKQACWSLWWEPCRLSSRSW